MTGGKTILFPVRPNLPGCALAAAIVAIRAFQPGAEPMSEWSWWSWLLMTAPAFSGFWAWAACFVVWAAAYGSAILAADVCTAVSPRRK